MLKNVTIDWTVKESVRSRLIVMVRRTLNKCGYPPDKQLQAIDTVMKQAELLAGNEVATIYEHWAYYDNLMVAEGMSEKS